MHIRFAHAALPFFVSLLMGPFWISVSHADIVTVMGMGDSITSGYHGEPSGVYRNLIQEMLVENGTQFDMVGEYHLGESDNDHQGLAGASIEYMTANYGNAVQLYQPDYVLLLAGTNNHFSEPNLNDFVDLYNGLVDMIRANSPDTSIIFSTVPKFGYDRPNTSYWTEEFVNLRNEVTFPNMNNAIEIVAGGHSDITVVDFYSVIDIATDLAGDKVHPNLYGQEKLGRLFGDELLLQINAVPEPGSGILAMLFSLGMTCRRRRSKCTN